MTTRLLQTAIVGVVLFMIGYVIYNRFFDKNNLTTHQNDSTTLPKFEFQSIKNGIISYKDCDNDKQTVINFFHPDCIHCQEMGRAFMLRKPLLTQTNLVLISTAPIVEIKKYAHDYQLDNQENIQFGQDTSGNFFKYFGDAYVPMLLIYNPDHTRKAILKGDDTTPNDVMSILSNP
jgi:thiol-disulfide isomerase/thioredoxin